MEKTPTYDEFKAEVEKHFKKLNPGMNEETAEAYLNGDEATFEIKATYKNKKKKYEAGEITRDVLMIGCTSAVAYCLYMMY